MAWTAGQILTAADLEAYLPQDPTTWSSPIASGASVGNGTVAASYTRAGDLIVATFSFTLGSTSTVTADLVLTLPVTAANINSATTAQILESGVALLMGVAYLLATTQARVRALNAAGTFLTTSTFSATNPFTWGTGDVISFTLAYIAAT